MTRRCLITGANGFVGAHLAKALLARGDTVRCLVRPQSSASSLAGLAVERAAGDVTDPRSLAEAMRRIEVVFHLAGTRRGASRDDFMRVNADGTRLVCEAMISAGARRLVYCGSLAASGPSTADRPRIESDPFEPTEWYGESKAAGEEVAFSFKDRLEITSIRPSRILGPGDHENLTFFKLVKRGFVLRLSGPRRPLSMVDVDDVVSQMLLQADRPEAVGEAFFCSSDEQTSVTELMETVATMMGKKTRTLFVPATVLSAVGRGADVVSKVSGKRLPVNRKLARQLLASGWTCSIDKAKTRLGYRPSRTIFDSLRRSYDSYVALHWL